MSTQIDTYALCTLDEVTDFLKIEIDKVDPPEDDLVVALINRTSARIETYCNRKFKSRTYTEYHDGEGSNKLYTYHYPIITVSGIWDDSTWSWDSDTLISSSDYRVSNDARHILLKDWTFGDYTENVKIALTAGYTTVPYDITDVCINEVTAKLKIKDDVHVYSKSMEDGSLERYQTGFLPSSLLVLDKYLNKVVI